MDRVIIFDTTLRDGEQAPGFSMNTMEKLEMARQLARLQVDVIEAGFPISSDEDFEATREVARQVGVSVATISRFINHNAPVSVETSERIQQAR